MDSVKHTLQTRVKKVPVLQVPERAMVTPSNLSKFKTVEIESERDVVPMIPQFQAAMIPKYEPVESESERDDVPRNPKLIADIIPEYVTIEIESKRDGVSDSHLQMINLVGFGSTSNHMRLKP